MPHRRVPTAVLLFAACVALAGCYTLQAVRGQLEMLGARRPLDAVRADPATDPRSAALLAVAAEARDLAQRELGLRSGSYRSFVRLPREWPVWSVVVAPELGVEPRRQCFLIVGCLAYRGFFDAAAAEAWAARARARGDDAFVVAVPAYSTLGWFDDPVLWSMLRWDAPTLAATIAHELAHEALYTGDDTAFDEAFAEVVGEAVVGRMFAAPERAAELARWRQDQALAAARQALQLEARADLARLYAGAEPAAVKRAAKRERLARLRDALAALDPRRAEGEWDNARLALTATYAELVPGFEAVLAEAGGDLARYRARAAALARLAPDARRAELAAAAARAAASAPADAQRSSRARAE